MTEPKIPRQCTAKSKRTGKRCQRPPILGATVCRMHGGASPQVKRKAAERLADLIDPDRALREMARLAYSDIRDVIDERGAILPIKLWPEELAAAVSSVEVLKRNVTAGDGQMDDVLKVRFWDKPKNLEMIGKHLGILKESVEVTGKDGGPIETKGVEDQALVSRLEAIIAAAKARGASSVE